MCSITADAGVDRQRRGFVAAGGALLALLSVGLIGSARAQTPYLTDLFSATTIDDALAVLGSIPVSDAAVDLALPGVVEDGAVVPVRVSSTLDDVEEIYVLVPSNPYPVAVRFEIPDGTEPFISIRLKLAETGTVYAVVRAKGRLYSRVAETRVTVGGCV
ncbi:thiosulfate oxidation carrier protein SoxY [Thiocapsa sp.]|uniref:thiosulfate oxidation carrier protein SoxY n=1 Tax=Thiocapsa sp. TaxID=2024551 RepID=UPI0025DCF9A2|nr:thiosulfate oxidation carrier protein SoxY [Thiocapsa sp.]